MNPRVFRHCNLTRFFACRTLSRGLAGIFLLGGFVNVEASDLVAESTRYQQVWAPDKVEFILQNGSSAEHVNSDAVPAPGFDPATIGPAIRESLSTYASVIGLPISFVQPGSPCTDGMVTARIVITAPAGELIVTEGKAGAGKSLLLPIQVESMGDCGYRSDLYTRRLAFDLSGAVSTADDGARPGEVFARLGRELVDETLLVWHPAWKVPEPGSQAFGIFSLDPLNPPATMGLMRGLFSGRGGRGLNGLVVTRIDTTQPEFRWTPLVELLSGPGQSQSITRISDVAYDFRLFTGSDIGLGLIPGQLVLERTDLEQPVLQLPSSLESCQTYFWTVRAHFRLGGFPRATEWMSLHNASGGVVGPWRFRRGERVRNAWNPALTYPAFATPSSTGKGNC